MSRLLIISIVFVIFTAVPHAQIVRVPDSRDNDNSSECYLHDISWVKSQSIVHKQPSFRSQRVAYIGIGRRLDILESVKNSEGCWVRISNGWVWSQNALSVDLIEEVTVLQKSNLQLPSSCFPYRTAYITGRMNIREDSTTSSKIEYQTSAGESYPILETYAGDSYCWLKTYKGWIALTNIVSNDISVILPEIKGANWFVHKITRAFKYMHVKSPSWFKYATKKLQVIQINPELKEADALVLVRTKHVSVRPGHAHVAEDALLASTLIHEACHVEQWDNGERYLRAAGFSDPAERECYGVQAKALSQLSPGHAEIIELRCLSNKFNSFFSADYIIKFVCGIGL